MNYNTLLDLAVDLGYELAMCGAETFRVEESVDRVLASYGVRGETFAIPNYLMVSIRTEDGTPITRMRRIGLHGNDLDSVEKFSGLSRAICNRKPSPQEALQWLDKVRGMRRAYSLLGQILGSFLGASGFAIFFGGSFLDAISGGLCGILICLINRVLDHVRTNQFFKTIAASYFMALLAYAFGAAGLSPNPDAATIGALMILVPGLLFTNAMRDIIYGDTNSGINRIVQVLLIGVAIALGTGSAWNFICLFDNAPILSTPMEHGIFWEAFTTFFACCGFNILFNIHGKGGLLCALGGALTWAVFRLCETYCFDGMMSYFVAAFFAAAYSEVMARIRKYPAISYLVISIFPLLLLGVASENPAFFLSEDLACGIGLIAMFPVIAIAVFVFVRVGFESAPYEFIEKEPFVTEYGVVGLVKDTQKKYRSTYVKYNYIGTTLCVLSPVPLLAAAFTERDFLVAAMLTVTLLIAGIGSMFFIVAGVRWASMQKLLKEGDYSEDGKKRSKRNEVVSSVYWLSATAVYLCWSFLTNDWHMTWLVWPIAGVLFAAVKVVCNLLMDRINT